jgi:hypothetical protein
MKPQKLKALFEKHKSQKIVENQGHQLFSVDEFRLELSLKVCEIFNYEVGYGVFRGMRLGPESTWNRMDRGGMILGIYEQEVITALSQNKGKILINLGAGDGFYVIGGLKSGLFEESIAFEMHPESQTLIAKNAKLNGVEKISTYGLATKNFWFSLKINPHDLEKTVVISDIEGDEFEIFDESAFSYFDKSILIIEIHDWVEDGQQKIQTLIRASLRTHEYKILTTGPRDLSEFEELSNFSDNERWLLCSEGRPKLMKWFVFKPKKLLI